MNNDEPYANAKGVESAIKDAARKAFSGDPSLSVDKRIQLEYFNRFLSRIFSEGEDSDWILKGGTGILARVPSSRSTKDVDLYLQGFTLEHALTELRRLAAVDIGDHFRFVYSSHSNSIDDDTQPYTDGYRVVFDTYVGVASRGRVKVDLVVGSKPTGTIAHEFPATALNISRLQNNPYRLYPVSDQIADKVCATMTLRPNGTSSREKDLVDIVVFAKTQRIDGALLSLALSTETKRRQIAPFTEFVIPSSWGPGYTKLSKTVTHCASVPTAMLAAELAARLINPALNGAMSDMEWSPEQLSWEPRIPTA